MAAILNFDLSILNLMATYNANLNSDDSTVSGMAKKHIPRHQNHRCICNIKKVTAISPNFSNSKWPSAAILNLTAIYNANLNYDDSIVSGMVKNIYLDTKIVSLSAVLRKL